MELRKVEKKVECKYAKRNDISKSDLKKFVPNKWMKIGLMSTFFATYSSLKEGIIKIGIVIGCVELPSEGDTILTEKGKGINTIENFLIMISGIIFLKFLIDIINYFVWRKKAKESDEDYIKHEKRKVLVELIVIIIFGLLIFFTEIYGSVNEDKLVKIYYDDKYITMEEYNKIKKDENINDNDSELQSKTEIVKNNPQYEKYSELYDKYSNNKKIQWYIKDMLDKDEGVSVGAYTKSVSINENDELILEDGNLYYKNSYVDKTMVEGIDRKIKYIVIPIREPEVKYIWLLAEDGTIYRNNNEWTIASFSTFDFDNDCNYNQTKSSYRVTTNPITVLNTRQQHKIIDMCYINEEINALSSLYFLTEDGELINCIGEKYIDLDEEFYEKLNSVKPIKKFDATVKYLNYNSRAYINVHIDESEYKESRDFWYTGCDENIKDIYFDCDYENHKIDDIYFLTENGNLYTQALQDTNSNCDTYLLSQIDSNVLKIEEDENSDVILVTNNGQRRKITKIMYYDGE